MENQIHYWKFKIYLYAKDPFEAKYQFLINKRENTTFYLFKVQLILIIIKFLFNIQTIWLIFIKSLKILIQIKNEKYWPLLMIWLLICSIIKKLNPIVTELFIRGRKLNISFVFIMQSYFAVPIPKKRELQ